MPSAVLPSFMTNGVAAGGSTARTVAPRSTPTARPASDRNALTFKARLSQATSRPSAADASSAASETRSADRAETDSPAKSKAAATRRAAKRSSHKRVDDEADDEDEAVKDAQEADPSEASVDAAADLGASDLLTESDADGEHPSGDPADPHGDPAGHGTPDLAALAAAATNAAPAAPVSGEACSPAGDPGGPSRGGVAATDRAAARANAPADGAADAGAGGAQPEPGEGVPADAAATDSPSEAGPAGDDGESASAPVGASQPKRPIGVSSLGGPAIRPVGGRPAGNANGPNAPGDPAPAGSGADASAATAAAASAASAVGWAEQFTESTAPDATPGRPSETAATDRATGPGTPDPALFANANRTDQPARAADAPATDAAPARPEPLTEDRFAAVNHARVAAAAKAELMPNGGSMQLRLDPPELGSLQVSLHIKDGVMTAAFQAQNEDAARLLSHTMGDLKASLEAQGITVDKLHVQQAPKDEAGGDRNASGGDRQSPVTEQQQQEARRDQQRRDAVQKLWDKLNGIEPLDLVA